MGKFVGTFLVFGLIGAFAPGDPSDLKWWAQVVMLNGAVWLHSASIGGLYGK